MYNLYFLNFLLMIFWSKVFYLMYGLDYLLPKTSKKPSWVFSFRKILDLILNVMIDLTISTKLHASSIVHKDPQRIVRLNFLSRIEDNANYICLKRKFSAI